MKIDVFRAFFFFLKINKLFYFYNEINFYVNMISNLTVKKKGRRKFLFREKKKKSFHIIITDENLCHGRVLL